MIKYISARRSRIWVSFCLLFLFSFVLSPEIHGAKMGKFEIIEIAFDAPDTSVELVGYLSIPPAEKLKSRLPALVVLLHQANESSESWNTFRDELLQSGYAVFAMDLRGYGLSTFDLKANRLRPKNTFYVGESMKFPDDIAFLLGKTIEMHGSKFDTTRFAVVGASVGGNAGLIYAQKDPRVKYLAMISPGLEYLGLRIVPVLKEFGDRPVFLAYADKDVYSRESVSLISDLVPRVLEIEEIDAMFHGNRLVNSNIPLRVRILQDLRKYLGEQEINSK